MSKHTPGPWRVEDDDGMQGLSWVPIHAGVPGPTYMDVAHVQPEFFDETEEIKITELTRANARLIAAAPELLESLKELFGMIKRGELVRDISADASPDYALKLLEFVPRLNRAMLAIAKAKGES